MKDFAGKNVFIAGGSAGIGLACARLFSQQGASVHLFARDKARLLTARDEVSACCADSSRCFDCAPLDVTDAARVKAVMGKMVEKHGPPDILVNCAGQARPRRFDEISPEQAMHTMTVNFAGTWNTVSALWPGMKKRGGWIVNTSSVAGFMGIFGYTDYCASKFAVIGFSEALKSEGEAFGIGVSVLCPPDTDTPGLAEENLTKPPETRAISSTAKLMTADEVASALLAGIKKGRLYIIPGFDGKLAVAVKRHAPWLLEAIMRHAMKKAVQ
ncbi:MAG: SDR family oxidoreductase [Desulfatibacillaceae bacterium]|nr:SDR family oxidoreductase [Desulfatibacillaceae bacterium]